MARGLMKVTKLWVIITLGSVDNLQFEIWICHMSHVKYINKPRHSINRNCGYTDCIYAIIQHVFL